MTCSSINQRATQSSWVNAGLRMVALIAAVWTALLAAPGASAQGTAADAIDRESFLRAISEVETGGNSRAVGRAGERGMYQFSRKTWQQHTSRSFYEAHNPAVSKVIAARHYEWLIQGFQRNGRAPTPYLLAAAWNAGLSKALSGAVPRSTRDYARRVNNIVASLAPTKRPAAEQRFLVATTE